MAIRKDKNSGVWHLDISTPSGKRLRHSAETKDRKAAQEYHDRLKAELWKQDKLGVIPDRTFEEAAVRFLRECEGQRDYATKLRHVAYWREQFSGRTVRSLKSDDIIDALPTHRYLDGKQAGSLTGSTRNRYVATIKRMLNLCEGWEWIDRVPRLPRYFEPDVRVRWESPQMMTALVRSFRLSGMRDAAIVALATGMREGELFGLTPSQIDLAQCNAWVTHEGAKSKRARAVPLNDDAMSVLSRLIPNARSFVFTRGNDFDTLVKQIDRRELSRACEIVGIKDFHWHDLRHTWASWHVQRGTPLMVLKELGGWETIEMVQKYAHLAPSHLAQHAGNVKFWSSSVEHKEKTPLSVAA